MRVPEPITPLGQSRVRRAPRSSDPVTPFAWYGGKTILGPRIVELLPAHDTYVEVFGGAAAVLFAKAPATLEIYNDTDSGLVTFFRVLRDQPAELERALRLTPYSREEFETYRASWQDGADDVERARRWYVRTRQAFGGSTETVGWAAEITGRQRGGTRSGAFVSSVDVLERFAERFRRVQVDHVDWRRVLDRYDRPGVAFYLDPPYHPETRGRVRGCYANELTTEDHDDLVARAIALRGSVVISGYDHPSYAPLVAAGFERIEFPHVVTVSHKLEGRGPRLEVVWRRCAAGSTAAPTPLWEELAHA